MRLNAESKEILDANTKQEKVTAIETVRKAIKKLKTTCTNKKKLCNPTKNALLPHTSTLVKNKKQAAKLMLAFSLATAGLNSITAKENFIYGFETGVKHMVEILE